MHSPSLQYLVQAPRSSVPSQQVPAPLKSLLHTSVHSALVWMLHLSFGGEPQEETVFMMKIVMIWTTRSNATMLQGCMAAKWHIADRRQYLFRMCALKWRRVDNCVSSLGEKLGSSTKGMNVLRITQCEDYIWVLLFPVVLFLLIRRQHYVSSSSHSCYGWIL